MELIDIVDDEDNVIGQKSRSECHGEDPIRHRAVSILTFRTDKKEEILLQKRSEKKERKPGRLEVTGGHLQAGEEYEEAAIREYAEELYSAEPEEIVLGRNDLDRAFKKYKESHDNREFFEVYETVNPGPFDLYEEEVEDAFFEDIETVVEMLEEEPERFTHATREAILKYRAQERTEKAVITR